MEAELATVGPHYELKKADPGMDTVTSLLHEAQKYAVSIFDLHLARIHKGAIPSISLISTEHHPQNQPCNPSKTHSYQQIFQSQDLTKLEKLLLLL